MFMLSNVLSLAWSRILDSAFGYMITYSFLSTKGEREDNFIVKVFDEPTGDNSVGEHINSLIYLFSKSTSSVHPFYSELQSITSTWLEM